MTVFRLRALAPLGIVALLYPGSGFTGHAHDHGAFGDAPSLAPLEGALQVRGRVCPRELRAAAGVPLADLWRANRTRLMGSAPNRGLGQPSSLSFQLPSAQPTSKSFLGSTSGGGSGLVSMISGLIGMILGLLGGGGVSPAGAFPTSPGLLNPAANASSASLLGGNQGSGSGGIFGVPGLTAGTQVPGSASGGWLDGNQNQSSSVGAGAPTPQAQGDLRAGWIANDPTSGHPRITRGFGNQKHPISGGTKMHSGIDISKARGSGPQAYAVGPSSVVSAGRKGGYGNCVILKHPGGFQTLYAHLASLAVSANTSIAPGTVVGPIGTTGNSTGPHLHFEVIQNGGKVDPKPYFPAYPYAK